MNDSSPSISPAAAEWGKAAKAGFQIIPDVLLKNQSKLGLNSTDMLVLMNVAMDWRSQRPFPRSTTIAGRMGVVVRTVQRALATLRKLGLLLKVHETAPDGLDCEACDLSGLIKRLAELAKDDPSYAERTRRQEARHGP